MSGSDSWKTCAKHGTTFQLFCAGCRLEAQGATRRRRRRCACRRVLLAGGEVQRQEQVGIDPQGPRVVLHRREGCGPRLLVPPPRP